MISVVPQYAIGRTCHNESILIGLFRQRQQNGSGCSNQQTFVGEETGDEPQRTSAWEARLPRAEGECNRN